MATWQILLILFVAAGGLGSLGGVVIGKVMLRRAKSAGGPLLSKRERIIYSASVLLGIAFILFGVFYDFQSGGGITSQDDETFLADGAAQTEEDFTAGADSIAYNKV